MIGLIAVKIIRTGEMRIFKYSSKDTIETFTEILMIDDRNILRAEKTIILGHHKTKYFPKDGEKEENIPKDVQKWMKKMIKLNEMITITKKPNKIKIKTGEAANG